MSWITFFTTLFSRKKQQNTEKVDIKKLNKLSTKIIKTALLNIQGTTRDQFVSPDFDFREIQNAYNTDSYIRQAIDKYIELMFKSGWSLVGSNQRAIDYIKKRLAYMSLITGIPIEQFFIEIGEDLVKYSNVFIVKARGETPGIKARGVTGTKPIAGYFLVSPLSIQIARDIDGTVVAYRQQVGNNIVDFKPQDVIHIYYKRERGMAFGTPFLIAALDDVRILRQLEENTIRLVHRDIWPLLKYKVGLPEPGFESTEEEIDQVKERLESMPLDGALVIPERHDVDIIGAEGEALDVERYLRYFEQRVFTALGVSEAIMGRSETVSRSSAEVASSEMHDRVKAFQRTIEIFVNNYIIKELLLEGGFNPVDNPKDMVRFQFAEIDLASKIALENHAIQKFITNSISHDEFRQEIGMDIATDYSKYFFYLFGKGSEGGANTVANKDQPQNQYTKRNSPKV